VDHAGLQGDGDVDPGGLGLGHGSL
jgi:hypothetical protein